MCDPFETTIFNIGCNSFSALAPGELSRSSRRKRKMAWIEEALSSGERSQDRGVRVLKTCKINPVTATTTRKTTLRMISTGCDERSRY